MPNPYQVVRDFEQALCEYTGAPYAVTTNSCTNALLLACALHKVETVTLPSHTYVGVPMSVKHAGGTVQFKDEPWIGTYQLKPYPIIDSAKRFRANMYQAGQFQCVSFHWGKTLGLGHAGAILHDSPDADRWLRKARFDGRSEGVHPRNDSIIMGWHCMCSPEVAAHGLVKLSWLPLWNDDLPTDDYPDLSKMECFR